MDIDPYFSPVPMTKPGTRRRGGWLGRILLFPLLVFSGCHMLLASSPIPLWHIERLHDPVTVTAIERNVLFLADGRRVRLPFIKRLPQGNPVFVRVVSHGVEVGADGRVFGLIDPRRMCGNDPVVFYRQRIDLSELAGLLDFDGIDDSIVPAEVIQDLKDNYAWSPDRHGLPYNVMSRARRLRLIFEAAKDRLKTEPSSSIPTASK